MSDMITAEEAQKRLDGTTPGPWSVPGQPDKVCAEGYTKNGGAKMVLSASSPSWMRLDEPSCNARLASAAPDLARTVIALHAQLADAEARGMEMALKTYRTGAGVDNGNYPLWAYDADYETAVRKKAEVHRKATSDRATRKDI